MGITEILGILMVFTLIGTLFSFFTLRFGQAIAGVLVFIPLLFIFTCSLSEDALEQDVADIIVGRFVGFEYSDNEDLGYSSCIEINGQRTCFEGCVLYFLGVGWQEVEEQVQNFIGKNIRITFGEREFAQWNPELGEIEQTRGRGIIKVELLN
ncbi:MAG: hypothetical protein FWE23_01345 [Chitinivibrionia bacterium]|nr:hypothetical protein [Chitinivibrionia bacterium]